jgi:hypothetical protein
MKRQIWLMILALGGIATLQRALEDNTLATPTMLVAVPAGNAAVGHAYFTSFPEAESPISESESWINGGIVGLDWADVRTRPGIAFGVDLPSQYADPTAVLAGTWGSDQQAEGRVTVRKAFSDCCHEVELRLRTTIKPHAITGYEILCSVVVGNPYLEIVRWNGPLNDFTYIGRTQLSCADGDVLKAIAHGDRITVYRNGEKVLEAEDAHFDGGSPGIGFYDTTRRIWTKLGFGTWQDFGFANFSAMDQARIAP